MKKIISAILTICMTFAFFNCSPVLAAEDDNIVYIGNGYIQEIETGNINTKQWIVVDGDTKYNLYVDYDKHIMKIDDEIIHFEVTDIELPLTRATIDYSTARTFQSKIPWKGSVILLTAGIAAVVSGGAAAGWAATIAGALTADAENIWVTFTQYDSKETYYSSYYSTYYKKSINKNITFYKTSISSSNKIYGPVDGGWFDPIRP